MEKLPKKMSKIFLTSPKLADNTEPIPMIEFEITASSIDFGGIDTLMFTSKQAVFSADLIDKRWREFESITIGPATKQAVIESGGRVLFQPKKFYGKELAKDILNLFKEKNILYLRPKKILFDSRAFLSKEGVKIKEQIIYETKCKEYSSKSKPPKGAIIVFTSPSTIECFLKNFGWDSSYKAVVIGTSTLTHLPRNIEYKIAKKPSIQACIDIAKEFL
jgi:uroporphyrinogen-III synthase